MGSGGIMGSGGTMGSGGIMGSDGVMGSGGIMGSPGKKGQVSCMPPLTSVNGWGTPPLFGVPAAPSPSFSACMASQVGAACTYK